MSSPPPENERTPETAENVPTPNPTDEAETYAAPTRSGPAEATGFAAVAGGVVAAWRRCNCGHPRDVHRHYRRGTNCSECDCPAFTHFKRRG